MFIIVLGGGINLKGEIPKTVYQRLDKALEVYQKNLDKNRKIIVSGKYSFLYQQINQFPPYTEAEKMASYLIKNGVSKKQIILEKKSKDTVGNAYFVKKIFLKKNEKKGIIITSNFHLERVKYVFEKIFGKDYQLDFIGVKEDLPKEKEKEVLERQKKILEKTKEILSQMKTDDHLYLTKRIYRIKYYREKRPEWVINFVAKGE
jgi:uncharacterized SAM-binding protein YcdF (DUF218 family)